MSAWLSHVPHARFGGRAIALDELPVRSDNEEHVEGDVAIRTLHDGTKHQIVKVFWEPDALETRLAALGWQANVTAIEHGWFSLDARRRPGGS